MAKVRSITTFTLGGSTVTFTDPRGYSWLGVTVDDRMHLSVPGATPEDLDEVMFMSSRHGKQGMAMKAAIRCHPTSKKDQPISRDLLAKELGQGISVMQTPQDHRVQ